MKVNAQKVGGGGGKRPSACKLWWGKNRVREEKNMREAMGRKRVPRILGFRLLSLRLLHVHTHAAFTYATFVYVRVCVCVSWLSYVAARSDFFPEHTRVKLSCIFSCLTNIEVKALTNNKPRKVEQSDTSSKEDWTVALVWQSFHNWVALVSTRLRPNLTVVKKSTSFLINRCKKRRMFFNKHFLANTCVFYATNLPSSIFLATNTI